MNRTVERLFPSRFDPIRVLEWVIALFTLAGGLYTLSPLYPRTAASSAGPGIISQLAASPVPHTAFAVALLVAAVLIIIGLLTNVAKIRSSGFFILVLARTFQITATFLVQGLVPVGAWIYVLTIMAVSLVLWTNARIEVRGE